MIADNIVTGNGEQGVLIVGDDGISFNSNTIGPDNVITNNGGAGVHIIDSNDNTIVANAIGFNGNIGGGGGAFEEPQSGVDIEEVDSDAGGPDYGMADRNTITKNSMWSNVGLGIDIDADGPNTDTPGNASCLDGLSTAGPDVKADPAGTSLDPNDCIDTPPQPSVVGDKITGRIGPPNNVDLCAFCTVEAFVTDNPPDPTGYGEGAIYIGRGQTDGTGDYSIVVDDELACGAKAGSVTVTVTDEQGNTSEFSLNAGGFEGTPDCGPTVTPTPTEAPTTFQPL